MGLKTIIFGPPDEFTVFENGGPLIGMVETKGDGSVVLNQRQMEVLREDNGGSLKGFDVQIVGSESRYLVNLQKK